MSNSPGANVCSVTASERSAVRYTGTPYFSARLNASTVRWKHSDIVVGATTNRGTSPCPPYSIAFRSPCSCFVGIPVEGPERITLQMTSGVSLVATSPNVSVIRSIPGPEVAVIDRAPARAAPSAMLIAESSSSACTTWPPNCSIRPVRYSITSVAGVIG
jgi:hypothetical protein